MSTIYPSQDVWFTNKAEEKVYHFLKEYLSKQWICYYNYYIKAKEADFILIAPGEGVCIIEVKGWDGKQIVDIVDNNTIVYNQNGTEYKSKSPYKQCRRYCYALNELIKRQIDKNIFIASIVCYPEMDEQTFQEKRLELISNRSVTLLKDDFKDPNRLESIILEKMDQEGKLSSDYDEPIGENINRIRESLFETHEQVHSTLTQYEKKMILGTKREVYSILSFIPQKMDEEKIREMVSSYLEKWRQGIKIILLTQVPKLCELIYEVWQSEFESHLGHLKEMNDFNFYDDKNKKVKNRIFNFECYYYNDEQEIEAFEVIDGQVTKNQEFILEQFDQKSDFNIWQYRIEHADSEKHIKITAGAGTGKTYSMVSRIGFLAYKNKYRPEELVERIIMITFTNEAAENMKKRLKVYFKNMFVLTQNVYYLSIMENIERMNISTIHSLVKRIIEKFSVYIGIGNSVSIESSVYKKRERITADIDAYINLHQEELLPILVKYEKYEIVKVVENLLHKLESKNINLATGCNLGWSTGTPEQKSMFKLITEIAQNVQQEIINEDFENNTVQLGNLILYLDQVIEALEKRNDLEKKVQYLFVDEFQDTDNVQISLIKRFQELFMFKLFVVGDIKQSIYRFRGAEHDAFEQLLRKEDGTVWNNGLWKEYALNKNYRSLNELLEFFDKEFTRWGKQDFLIYQEEDKLKGVKRNISKARMEIIDHKNQEEFTKKLTDHIQAIRDQLSGNETIGILTRTNKQIEQIRQICKQKGIRVETDIAENLYTLESTIDLYKLILALQFPKNPKYLYNLSLTNYCEPISNRIIYRYKNDQQKIVELFEKGEIGGIPKWNQYMEALKKEPVLRVIKQIIDDQRPWHPYGNLFENPESKLDEKKRYKRNLDCLMENIIEASNQDYITINKLRDFLYYKIFAKGHEDQREVHDELDKNNCKIICTTVHRSKGLEYTHVILPYCNIELEEIKGNELIMTENQIGLQLKVGETYIRNNVFGTKQNEELAAKVKEEIRILYVAMTRAEETFTWFKNLEVTEQSSKIKKSWQKFLGEEE
ncbi:MAG: hypothetical protein E7231_09725 [Cellulosilyticum sp.]|nr:hypothetical protein [Cellulosilyticum sp.]